MPEIKVKWSLSTILIIALNTIILLLLIELCSFAILKYKNAIPLGITYHPALTKIEKNPHMFDNFLGFRYVPNSRYGNLKISSDSFISNTEENKIFDLKNSKLHKRIFILGGSSLAGSGATSNNTTIPSFLEKLLNKNRNSSNDAKYQVINAGVDGYFTFNQLGYIVSDIMRYEPDMIIIFDGWNDYAYPVWAGGYLNERYKRVARVGHHSYSLYLNAKINERHLTTLGCVPNVLLKNTYFGIFLDQVNRKFNTNRLCSQFYENYSNIKI